MEGRFGWLHSRLLWTLNHGLFTVCRMCVHVCTPALGNVKQTAIIGIERKSSQAYRAMSRWATGLQRDPHAELYADPLRAEIQNERLNAPARMTEASMSPQFLKKYLFIYLFSCLGSELWHAGSLLHHAGFFTGARGPCGCAMGAPGAPQSCLLPAPCTQCSRPGRHLPPHSGTFLQAAPSVLTIWLTPLCSSKFRLGVTSSKKLFLAFISLTSPYHCRW